MKKYLFLFLTFLVPSLVFALPYYQQTGGLVPGVNDTYYIGTSTPSALEYQGIYTKNLTVSGTCTGCSATSFGKTWELNSLGILTPTTTVAVLLPAPLYATSTGLFDGVLRGGSMGGVSLYSMGSGVGTIGFNSVGYTADVAGYGALMQLAPSTGVFTMFTESNVSAGASHSHIQTLSWDASGLITLPQGFISSASSTLQNFTGVNATTTNATTTKFAITALGGSGSRLAQVNNDGSISSTAIPLNVGNGGTDATSFPVGSILTGNGTSAIVATGTQLTIGNINATSSSIASVFPLASTTVASFANSLQIPNSSSQTLNRAGQIAIDTTNNQFLFTDGTNTNVITGTSTAGFTISSSTVGELEGKTFLQGTSTKHMTTWPEPTTILGVWCTATTSGTALLRIGDGANWSNDVTCTSHAYTALTSNNTFVAGEEMLVQSSSTAGVVKSIFLDVVSKKTAQ